MDRPRRPRHVHLQQDSSRRLNAEQTARAEPSAQRTALDDATPHPDVYDDLWHQAVAQWPLVRWLRWHQKIDELMPAKAGASTIAAVQRLAYEKIRDEVGASPDAR